MHKLKENPVLAVAADAALRESGAGASAARGGRNARARGGRAWGTRKVAAGQWHGTHERTVVGQGQLFDPSQGLHRGLRLGDILDKEGGKEASQGLRGKKIFHVDS